MGLEPSNDIPPGHGGGLRQVRSLDLRDLHDLRELAGIPTSGLESIRLHRILSLEGLEGLKDLAALEPLDLHRLPQLSCLTAIDGPLDGSLREVSRSITLSDLPLLSSCAVAHFPGEGSRGHLAIVYEEQWQEDPVDKWCMKK